MNDAEKPYSPLLDAFQTHQTPSVIARLVEAGHRDDNIFCDVEWNAHKRAERLYVNINHHDAKNIPGRVIEALEHGHPFPKDYRRQVEMAHILARALPEDHDRVVVLFENMIEQHIVQVPRTPTSKTSTIEGDDVLLMLFSVSAYYGNLPLMKRIFNYVQNSQALLKAKTLAKIIDPFRLAIQGDQKETLNWLFDHFKPNQWGHEKNSEGNKVKNTISLLNYVASDKKDISWFELLLHHKQKPKNADLISLVIYHYHPHDNNPSLHQKMCNIIDLLLDHGAPLQDSKGSCLYTLMDQQSFSQGEILFCYLINKGADINWKTEKGMPLTHISVHNEGYLDALLDHFVDIRANDAQGIGLLLRFVLSPRSEKLPLIERLINMGAELQTHHPISGKPIMEHVSPLYHPWLRKFLTQIEIQQLNRDTTSVSLQHHHHRI